MKDKILGDWCSPICSILYFLAAYRTDNLEATIIFYVCSGLYAISSVIQEYKRRQRASRGPRLDNNGEIK